MMRKLLSILVILLVSVLASSLETEANGLPYGTYTYSSATRRFVNTQDAYVPLSISYDLAGIDLQDPKDISIDRDDNIYVADAGAGRIVRYSLQDDTVEVIGEGFLEEPTGVHAGLDGNLYVSDFSKKEAYRFVYDSVTGTYVADVVYSKPLNTPYFQDNDPYDPTKIVTDQGGNVYVLLAGNINGMAQFKNDGEFFGFFGGNTIPNTWDNVLRYMLFDEEQRREWFQMIPDPVYNVAIDKDGLLLTTTKGQMGYLKLNIANFVYSSSVWGFDDIEDVFVGPYNTIFTVNKDGMITEYAPDGSVLFVFSGTDQNNQKGLFKSPTGIAVDSKNNIYAVDDTYDALQIFTPTAFADLVHYAIELYQDGKYLESLGPWQEVLSMNSLFDLANKGIGDAYFADMNYEKAMDFYEVARDEQGYSDAFWEVRNAYLLGSGQTIVVVLLSLLVLYFVNLFTHVTDVVKAPLSKLKAWLSKFKLYRELVFPFALYKKPGDGYYGIKREGKGSNLSATIYLALFFLSYMLFIYRTSFLFNPVIVTDINIVGQMITVLLPFLLFVVANYLVSSIRDGEGKLSDVYQATAYTMLPMIITLPLVTVISNGLTYNEAFIFDTLLIIGIIVTAIYMIIMIKEIHFYDMKPTIANILITVFTAVMILAVSFIIYLLLSEVWTLVTDIIREVTVRG